MLTTDLIPREGVDPPRHVSSTNAPAKCALGLTSVALLIGFLVILTLYIKSVRSFANQSGGNTCSTGRVTIADASASATGIPTVDVAFILGGQIISSPAGSSTIVPAFHVQSRIEAAAMYRLHAASAAQPSPSSSLPRFIVSGGYNVGVRYELNKNTVFTNANFSFEAFAVARTLGPSEGTIMKGVLCSNFSVPSSAVLVEETSATTDENAEFGGLILSRYGLGVPVSSDDTKTMFVGVISNLFHLPRAVPTFVSRFEGINFNATLTPLYAEDWCCLNTAVDWPELMRDYYTVPRSGVQFNATAIAEIMKRRRNGDLTVSVGSLLDSHTTKRLNDEPHPTLHFRHRNN